MSDEIYCRHCGTKLDPEDHFCAECGSPVLTQAPYVSEPPLSEARVSEPIPVFAEPRPPVTARRPDEKFCSQCGAIIPLIVEICPRCGGRQPYLRRTPRLTRVEHRDWLVVVILTIVTVGVYGIYWLVTTKNEMVDMGADIPTAWLLIIPIANIYFIWKYAHGVEFISEGSTNGILLFLLGIIFFPAATYLTQTELNRHALAYQSRYYA